VLLRGYSGTVNRRNRARRLQLGAHYCKRSNSSSYGAACFSVERKSDSPEANVVTVAHRDNNNVPFYGPALCYPSVSISKIR
jgi:hypothetical protein